MAELLEGIEELRSRVNRLNASGIELEMDVDLFNESGFDEDLNFLDLPHINAISHAITFCSNLRSPLVL